MLTSTDIEQFVQITGADQDVAQHFLTTGTSLQVSRATVKRALWAVFPVTAEQCALHHCTTVLRASQCDMARYAMLYVCRHAARYNDELALSCLMAWTSSSMLMHIGRIGRLFRSTTRRSQRARRRIPRPHLLGDRKPSQSHVRQQLQQYQRSGHCGCRRGRRRRRGTPHARRTGGR